MFRSSDVPERFGSYTRGLELGRGAFAVVFQCKKAGSRHDFAAKAFDLRFLRTSPHAEREVKKLQREASILKQVPSHPNIVKFFDIVQEGSDWLFFILELVVGGDLMKTMVTRPGRKGRGPRPFLEPEALYIFKQLVEGLGWLHEQGVIHRDLKLENVLVVRAREVGDPPMMLLLDVKITDFGLSRFIGPEFSEPRSTVGSPRYMAPEVKATSGTHHLPADFWSLGILLSILLGGCFPCDGLPHVPQEKLDGAVKKLPASLQAQSVASGLLQLRPEARMTIVQVRKHVWLTASPAPCNSANGKASSSNASHQRQTATASSSKSSSKSSSNNSPAAASRREEEPQARFEKRPRINSKSLKSRSQDLTVWTHGDEQRVTSAMAGLTSAFGSSAVGSSQESTRKRTPPHPSIRELTCVPSTDKKRPLDKEKSRSTDRSRGAAARGQGRGRGRGSSSAKQGTSAHRSPKKATIASRSGASLPQGKPAAAPRGASSKVMKAMKNATKANVTDRAMKRPAKAEVEVMKRPASAGRTGTMKRPAAR